MLKKLISLKISTPAYNARILKQHAYKNAFSRTDVSKIWENIALQGKAAIFDVLLAFVWYLYVIIKDRIMENEVYYFTMQ